MGIFGNEPIPDCNSPCMHPGGYASAGEIEQVWMVVLVIWAVLVVVSFLLVRSSKGVVRDWVMALPFFSGLVGLGSLGLSVISAGLVAPDGEYGSWMDSISHYSTLSVMVYYEPVETFVRVGFSVFCFGTLISLGEIWRRWWSSEIRSNKDALVLYVVLGILFLSVISIPVLGLVEPPDSLGILGEWGVFFLLLVFSLSILVSLSVGLGRKEGESVVSEVTMIFLLSTWAGMVLVGAFWLEASVSFSRHFDKPVHLNSRDAYFLFAALTPLFGSLSLYFLAWKDRRRREFESRLMLMSTAILLLAICYIIVNETGAYAGKYSEALLGLHEHVLLSVEFLWLTYFGTEVVDDS